MSTSVAGTDYLSGFNGIRVARSFVFCAVCCRSLYVLFVSSNPAHGEVYSIQHYVIKFVSDFRQVGGFEAIKPEDLNLGNNSPPAEVSVQISNSVRGHHGRDRMVAGFTTVCVIGAYHH